MLSIEQGFGWEANDVGTGGRRKLRKELYKYDPRTRNLQK